jgi:hypothetical protein
VKVAGVTAAREPLAGKECVCEAFMTPLPPAD